MIGEVNYMNREKIYAIIGDSEETYRWNTIYNYFMMATIIISLIPLAFKTGNIVFSVFDKITAGIFIIDYLLRLITADKKICKGKLSFFIYPFTIMALIDLLSILPSLTILSSGFRLLKMFRLLRTFRVFKAFKMLRYSRSIIIIAEVIKKQKTALIAVGTFAFGYVLVSALVVFNVEPDTFQNFFDAVYWATVSLTTVGYGDIYPVSTAGRLVTMLSSIIGIAIVALPSGIITAGYLKEIGQDINDDSE